jgi:PKD repeat protein
MKKFFLPLLFIMSIMNAYSQAPGWAWVHGASGPGIQEAYDVSTDPSGNAFITGSFQGTIAFDTLNHITPGLGILLNKYDPAGNLLWSQATGSIGSNAVYQVSTDPWGNAYICGRFAGQINFGPYTLYDTTGSLYHFFLVKYDPAGNVLWAESRSGSSNGSDLAWTVHADASGGVYIAGSFQSDTLVFGSDSLFSNNTGSNFFIVKYDSSGTPLWARRSYGNYFEMAQSMTTDMAGNVYATGWFMSDTLIFGTDTVYNHRINAVHTEDIFLVKYDPNGNQLWVKSYGGNDRDIGYNVTSDIQSNIYLTGHFRVDTMVFNQDTLMGTAGNTTNYFLVKCDSSANTQWIRYGGGNASGYSVAVDSALNVYFSGSFNDSLVVIDTMALVRPAIYKDPSFITRLDAGGNIVWGTILGSGGDDQNGIALGTNNDIFFGGDYEADTANYFFIIGTDTLPATGTENIFIAKLQPDTATVIAQLPAAAFYSSDTSWCDKTSIDYFDISTNNPVTWQWYFQGAVPDTSTSQNPTGIYYPAFGTFDVQLIACNSAGCDTLLMTSFITEHAIPAAPSVSQSQDTLYSTAAFSYQWWDQNGMIAGANDSFYVIPGPGTYFVIITDSVGCSVASTAIVIASIHEATGDASLFSLFPNPGSGEMTLSITAAAEGIAEISIYDLAGKKIKSFRNSQVIYGKQQLTFDISDMVKGIYIFECKKGSVLWHTKMFVE